MRQLNPDQPLFHLLHYYLNPPKDPVPCPSTQTSDVHISPYVTIQLLYSTQHQRSRITATPQNPDNPTHQLMADLVNHFQHCH